MMRLSKSRIAIVFPLAMVLSHSNPLVAAASKPHIITFGKWSTVQCSPDYAAREEDNKPVSLKVRPLLVDAHIKEFTLGFPHEVTDRLFVVRRAYRVNDSLPQEPAVPPQWRWQRGGWLLVDRATAHISAISLPDFDVVYSAASWYRDYVAYCGVSEDGKKFYAVVAQIGRRKPVLKRLLDSASVGGGETKAAVADCACPMPAWQRVPTRVSFEPAGAPKQTFAIRGRAVDLVTLEEDEEEAAK